MTEVWHEHKNAISGIWKCISYEMFSTTTPTPTLLCTPHGSSPLGRVYISPQGWLAAHLARPDRLDSLKSGKPWMSAPDSEVAKVARGLAMYCGYMKLYRDYEGGLYWQTKVEVSSDPNRVGGIEERKVTLLEEGGREYMILEPKQDMLMEDGTATRAVLKWEKFE